LILWVPRAAGILVAAFLGIFALDSFGPGVPLTQAIPAFLIHLIPTYLVLAVVAVAWRFEWVGALACLALAVAYGVVVNWRMDWVAGISGPLLVLALLFFWSWRHHDDLRASAR
jgi:hypothetical protein